MSQPVDRSNAPNANARALAFLRIAVGIFFLIFGEYKVFGTQFALHGGFQFWINKWLQEGGAYPFMAPVLKNFVLPRATPIAFPPYSCASPMNSVVPVSRMPVNKVRTRDVASWACADKLFGPEYGEENAGWYCDMKLACPEIQNRSLSGCGNMVSIESAEGSGSVLSAVGVFCAAEAAGAS